MSDTTGNVIFYVLLLVLPLSALFARRLPLGRVAVLALAWIGIFATGLLVVGNRQPEPMVGLRHARLVLRARSVGGRQRGSHPDGR